MSVHALAFALYGVRAGLITRDGGRTTLTYDPAYLAVSGATPLSLSMPLAGVAYPARYVESHLKGLLPDHDDVRARWAAKFKVKPGDLLGLVAAIGADTAGGAIYAEPDALDELLASPGQVHPETDADIAARLRRLREDDSAWDDDDEGHWSLAGGQGKFTLVQTTDGGWGRAVGGVPSTHIVKPGILRIRAQGLAEHVSMRTLALLGLDVAATEYLQFEDQPAIVVTRYDRRQGRAGAMIRLHQEDMVQTFAMDPRRKYEADGGPGIAKIADRLRASADEASVERFVDATIAGYLLGAPDGHAKNYSMLLLGSAATLAPLYDVSTGLIPTASGRLRYTSVAMSIGGEKFGEVEAKHWDKLAGAAGVPTELVRFRVEQIASDLPDAFAAAIEEVPSSADSSFLANVVRPNIAALNRQSLKGLSSSRRVGGRIVTPFLPTLESPTSLPATDDELARATWVWSSEPTGQ